MRLFVAAEIAPAVVGELAACGAWLEGLTDRRFGVAPVNAITLFESRLSPRGHVDIVLRHTSLAT